jgi:membrane protein YdbS with pleckstrin-like domain
MAFQNQQIETQALPAANALELTALPEEHRREVLVQGAITVGIMLCFAFIPQLIVAIPGTVRVWLLLIPAGIAVGGVLITALLLIRLRHKGYAMREHDIVFCTGLFWRKTTVLPFNRIQHAEVTHGPLQRRFGLATLKFFTAGGAAVDLNIEGLRAGDAEALREDILRRSAAAR